MSASYLNLKVDGQFVSNVILSHVSVMQELNRHWWCQAQCRHLEDQRLGVDQQAIIRVEQWLGKDLQVLAIGDDGPHVIFDGFVLEVELIYELSSAYTAIVQSVTRSYKMDGTPRHSYYLGKTLTDVAPQLGQNSGVKVSVQCQDAKPLNYVQWGETDFEFLRRLADDHGAWLRPSADGVEIYDSFQPGTEVRWKKASEANALLSFSLKGALATPSFCGAHYHFHQMKSQTYQNVNDEAQFFDSAGHLVDAARKASKDTMPPGYLHQRSRIVTLDEYEQRLKKESVRSIGSSIVGSGQTQDRDLTPGNTVQVRGTLDADGLYGVTQVAHSWDPNGYTNQFRCTPWKNYVEPRPPQTKPWNGLVPARVVDNNDPQKMGRIQVQYFWQDDGAAYWARMITPHAGADRGFMFMPEVGDEVVVGFEDGDVERPMVLGCVWNGVDQAPRQEFWGGELESNDVKRIVTKSGHRMQFVDKPGKESIALATPKFLKLSMIENTAETGRSTITLHSENGDIFLSAPNGRIHLLSKYVSKEVG
jgi:type VI secretion system secreted protein VgrG